jgi:hypothetical protein
LSDTPGKSGKPPNQIKPCFLEVPGKNDLHIRVLAGFPGLDGLEHAGDPASVQGPLEANRRGANLPYFNYLSD